MLRVGALQTLFFKIRETDQAAQDSNAHSWKRPVEQTDRCNEISNLDPPDVCAVLFQERENLSFVRPKFFNPMKRRALIDTGSDANALRESLFHDLQTSNPNFSTSEKPSFHSVWIASGQKIPIGRHYVRQKFLVLPTRMVFFLGTIFPKNMISELIRKIFCATSRPDGPIESNSTWGRKKNVAVPNTYQNFP